MIAESRARERESARHGVASMRPRSDDRGEKRYGRTLDKPGLASMRPRSDDRGELDLLVNAIAGGLWLQ